MRVSVIIPTLNEARALPRTLRILAHLDPAPHEVIVADGGSTDATATVVAAYGDRLPLTWLVSERRGRAAQMNAGAARATGEALCFLHADTSLPDDALAVVAHTLADRRVAAGGFVSLMRGPTHTRWLTSLHNYLKTYYAPLFYRPYRFWVKGGRLLFGDQVIFCRADLFRTCGGYDDALPIMEEADLLLRLNDRGRIRQVNRVVESSDRRVAKWGFWRSHAIFLYVGFLWGVGYSPEKLKRLYEDIR